MSDRTRWAGRSRGTVSGHRIFVFILNVFGVEAAYLLLIFVAFYYFLFARSTRHNLWYFRNIHHLKGFRALAASYRNYFRFGQVLIDKVATLSGRRDEFTIEHDGYEEHLKHFRDKKSGGILLSAHVGNWEIAGQKLERLDTRFNVLMYDNEAEQMKNYMAGVMQKKNFNIIPIREDLSHLVQLHKAFSNHEILVMHGDRYLPGAETIEKTFLGRKAKFPVGPFLMAAKFGVPITAVFSMKEGRKHYHFYARQAIEVRRSRSKTELEESIRQASDQYIAVLEEMVRKYPEQWFNFYDFWEHS